MEQVAEVSEQLEGAEQGGSLTTDKDGGRAETVLDSAEGTERNTDWKASLVRCT